MDILANMYHAKQVEYIIALLGLLGFIVFWRVLTGPKTKLEKVNDMAGTLIERFAFLAPSDVVFHSGHAWARVESADIVTVGMDDFAVKLLGSADSISLPELGSRVRQGSLGWGFKIDSRVIHMLSPIQGEIVAVNDAVANAPGVAFDDPYGNGWLFKVKSTNLTSNMKNMIPDCIVGQWLENIGQTLADLAAPQAEVQISTDRAQTIRGIARAVDPEGWDHIARTFFLTK